MLGSVRAVIDDFEQLFRDSYPRLVALGTSMSGDREVGRDLAQETMLRAHDRWDELQDYDAPGAWLRRVMHNLLIDHHRSSVSERSALQRLKERPVGEHDPSEGAAEQWMTLMRSLSSEQRVVATLYYAEDLSVGTIAAVLDMSEGAVKSNLFKVRRRLRTRVTGSARTEGRSDD